MTRGADGSRPNPKAQWRAWAERVALLIDWVEAGRAVRAVVSQYLEELEESATVLTYAPMAQEIDLTPLVDAHPRHGFLLTRTPASGPLTLHPYESRRERHRYGFEQPTAEAPVVTADEVDVAFVPGVAFDLRGVRLGRGKGYYDVLLPGLGRATLIGIAPAPLVVPELPWEEHDVRVSCLATELGLAPAED
jgi:5-formyltetrahydrofolate cyclo-ligase